MKKEILMTPGPSQVPYRVRAAEARPAIHHRGAEFKLILAELIACLKELLGAGNDLFILGATGTGAMEATIVNTLSPGDRVVVYNAGKFGERYARMNRAFGVEVVEIKKEWGEILAPDELERTLRREKNVSAVFVTHSETSAGVVNPIAGLGEITARHDALFIVDSVSAAGGLEIKVDDWGIDMLAGGSQKSLMTPPGLSFVTVSPRAWRAYGRAKLPRFYLDLGAYKKRLEEKGETPYTIPVSLCLALHEALKMMKEEGFDNVFARHRRLAHACRAGVTAMGLELFSVNHSDVVTVFRVPEGIDGEKLVAAVREKHGVRVSGGQKPYRGRIVRIATMGYVTERDVLHTLCSVEMSLSELGYETAPGSAARAAEEVFLNEKKGSDL
ncbi:MAG: alanine--glyoxylate aminotransferase family protein [bacterium]